MRQFVIAAAAASATLVAAPAAAEPVDYVVDEAHTAIMFSISRFGFNNVHGRFNAFDIDLTLDEENPENSSVSATISVISLDSGDPTRNFHLMGERWFDRDEAPTMTFQSTSVEPVDDTHAAVTGDLTLKGVTVPVTLDVTLNRIDGEAGKRRAGFTMTGGLDRLDFGVGGEFPIGPEVEITIELLADEAADD